MSFFYSNEFNFEEYLLKNTDRRFPYSINPILEEWETMEHLARILLNTIKNKGSTSERTQELLYLEKRSRLFLIYFTDSEKMLMYSLKEIIEMIDKECESFLGEPLK